MLLLTRKIGEVICIGDDIRIILTDIDRNKIRLAIDCPKSIPVWRQELLPLREEREEDGDAS